MANTLTLKVNYNGSLQTIGATDKLYWQKAGPFAYGAAGAILVGEYNDGFHIVNSSNDELCTSAHPTNLKYVSSSTVSIDGGAAVDLNTVTTSQCLDLNVTCSPAAEIIESSFFVYGSSEENTPVGIRVKGFKQGDTSWSDVGGSANALSLGISSFNTEHNKYFGLSVMPITNGALSGTLKCSVTCV